MSIRIIEVFVEMREILGTHNEILQKIEELERKNLDHDDKITLIFEYIKQLEQSKQEEKEYQNRKRIGFKTSNED